MTITFPVSDVQLGESNRYKTIGLIETVKAIARTTPEAAGANFGTTFLESHFTTNGFLNAVHVAFDLHYPLILSPDDVWTVVSQGFAAHVNANAEKLRKQFVQHEGKVKIVVRRDMFVKGAPDNNWMGAFSEFSDRIGEHIGKKRDLLVSDFTTTGPVERAASELVLMDAMKAYFEYTMRTCCGIPNITLTGTVADWESVRDRARVLAEFDCKPWIDALIPVLDQFVSAARGSADQEFWKSLYKAGGGSEGPYVTGFINVFFPYLKRGQTNQSALNWASSRSFGGGPNSDDFPNGLSSVPFEWEYHKDVFEMKFLGGFVGATQDSETLAVRPAMGWAVTDSGEK